MSIALRCLAGFALAACAGCHTTGDPRAGGLFHWSEKKARARQADRHAALREADAELAREQARTGALAGRRDALGRESEAEGERLRAQTAQRNTMATAMTRQARQLERDAFTPSIASRARQLAREVSRVRLFPPDEAIPRLRAIDEEIKVLRARLGL